MVVGGKRIRGGDDLLRQRELHATPPARPTVCCSILRCCSDDCLFDGSRIGGCKRCDVLPSRLRFYCRSVLIVWCVLEVAPCQPCHLGSSSLVESCDFDIQWITCEFPQTGWVSNLSKDQYLFKIQIVYFNLLSQIVSFFKNGYSYWKWMCFKDLHQKWIIKL